MPIPASMPAAVFKGDGKIAIEEIALPDVGPEEVLLEISHCGICGTDLHMVLDGWGRPGSVGGHEYSAIVLAVGSAVSSWKPGDAVVGGPTPGCGSCDRCVAGHANLCRQRERFGSSPFTGAFALYKLNRAETLYRVPEQLDLRAAALTEPVAVALRGVRRSGARAGDRVLVTGGGPIGLLTVAVLKATGVEQIAVSEPNEARRRLALAMGASSAIHPSDLEQPVMPMDTISSPYRVAIECSGRVAAAEAALASLDVAGTLVLSGAGMDRPKLDTNRVILNELRITGTFEYEPADYRAALDLLAAGTIPAETVIEPVDQPLDRLQWAIEQLAAGELAGKVMVAPHA
jgi:(R,R)-butanediol dehydrogenase/meso-butanediol dehydrogenase/diacetyl reductase